MDMTRDSSVDAPGCISHNRQEHVSMPLCLQDLRKDVKGLQLILS